MNSFQTEIGRRRPRKTENKSYRSVSFLSGTKQKIKKKIAKKFEKLKNTIMNSFKTEISGKRMRKRENKNYNFVPFRSYPTHNRNFQKNSKKIQKIEKYHYGFISVQNRLEEAEKNEK